MSTCKYYYVYHLPPTATNPEWHYGYFALTLPADELPDCRYWQPKWLYNDETKTYAAVEENRVEQPGRARRLAGKVAQIFESRKWRL